MTENKKVNDIPNVSFTLQQMKEQASVLYNVINEIRPIVNDDESNDTYKLNRICNLIGMMYGTADFTIKKMIDSKMESVSAKEIIAFGDEYIEFFKKANTKKEEETTETPEATKAE